MKKIIPFWPVVLFVCIIIVQCNPKEKKPGTVITPVDSDKKIEFLNKDFKNILPEKEEGVVLAEFEDNTNQRAVAKSDVIETIHTEAMKKSNKKGFLKIKVKKGDEESSARQLRSQGAIWSSPNYSVQTQGIPDDPHYGSGSMWSLANINQAAAWTNGNFGKQSVVCGIIDEGILPCHEDLAGQLWMNFIEKNGVKGVDDDGNGYIDDINGWNWVDNTPQIYSGTSDDHGTHVAGTIGALGGNKLGIVGMSPNVSLVALKFLGVGGGWIDNAIKAVDYLTDLKSRHNLNVILSSNSWGGGGFSQGMVDALNRAAAANIGFVAAAGNNGDQAVLYPAAYKAICPNVVSVGASDWSNNRAGFSCYHPTNVDIFAPGTGIRSTLPGVGNTSGYGDYSGTSMATPHVSGALLEIAAVNPGMNFIQLKEALFNAGTSVPALQGTCVTGKIININNPVFFGQTQEINPARECFMPPMDEIKPTIPTNFHVYDWGIDPTDGKLFFGIDFTGSSDAGGVAGYVVYLEYPTWTWGVFGKQAISGMPVQVYNMTMVAYDNAGNVSDTSNHYILNPFGENPPPTDTQAPSVPQNPSVTIPTVSSLTFNWNASSDNVAVTGYRINSRPAGGSWAAINIEPHVNHLFNGLSSNTTYEFNIQARDAAGNFSANSVTVSGTTLNTTTPPPGQISVSLSGSVLQYKHTLTWVITNPPATMTQQLQRKDKPSGAWQTIHTGNSPYSYTQTNMKKFYYRVMVNNVSSNTVELKSRN